MTENIPRVLPEGMGIKIDLNSWDLPPVFQWLAATGGMRTSELLKTFNCGIGMVLVVSSDRAAALSRHLSAEGETVSVLGYVTADPNVIYEGSLL